VSYGTPPTNTASSGLGTGTTLYHIYYFYWLLLNYISVIVGPDFIRYPPSHSVSLALVTLIGNRWLRPPSTHSEHTLPDRNPSRVLSNHPRCAAVTQLTINRGNADPLPKVTLSQSLTQNISNNVRVDINTHRASTRIKKPPCTMTNDFLWN
jgi:hypothetical protein